jgi:hypothetical protein
MNEVAEPRPFGSDRAPTHALNVVPTICHSSSAATKPLSPRKADRSLARTAHHTLAPRPKETSGPSRHEKQST